MDNYRYAAPCAGLQHRFTPIFSFFFLVLPLGTLLGGKIHRSGMHCRFGAVVKIKRKFEIIYVEFWITS
jgi:hypothetical protein